jgi:hypothetical protein
MSEQPLPRQAAIDALTAATAEMKKASSALAAAAEQTGHFSDPTPSPTSSCPETR